MEQCWEDNPNVRPSISTVSDFFCIFVFRIPCFKTLFLSHLSLLFLWMQFFMFILLFQVLSRLFELQKRVKRYKKRKLRPTVNGMAFDPSSLSESDEGHWPLRVNPLKSHSTNTDNTEDTTTQASMDTFLDTPTVTASPEGRDGDAAPVTVVVEGIVMNERENGTVETIETVGVSGTRVHPSITTAHCLMLDRASPTPNPIELSV
jgi:hypothetical protein